MDTGTRKLMGRSFPVSQPYPSITAVGRIALIMSSAHGICSANLPGTPLVVLQTSGTLYGNAQRKLNEAHSFNPHSISLIHHRIQCSGIHWPARQFVFGVSATNDQPGERFFSFFLHTSAVFQQLHSVGPHPSQPLVATHGSLNRIRQKLASDRMALHRAQQPRIPPTGCTAGSHLLSLPAA
jgi:hypothetical protein